MLGKLSGSKPSMNAADQQFQTFKPRLHDKHKVPRRFTMTGASHKSRIGVTTQTWACHVLTLAGGRVQILDEIGADLGRETTLKTKTDLRLEICLGKCKLN